MRLGGVNGRFNLCRSLDEFKVAAQAIGSI
jgi:hypothetical protein